MSTQRDGPRSMMVKLWFPMALVAVTLACCGLAIVAGYLDPRRRWGPRVPRWWSRMMLFVGRVQVAVEGTLPENTGPVVYVANHASNLDIPVLGSLLPRGTLWLAKRELFAIPVFGRALRAVGQIPVDRQDREAARASIDRAAEQVRRGASVVLFPEGTRSADGRLRPFKLGFVHLAVAAEVPVVPVVLAGSARLWPKGAWSARPGVVRVRILPPQDLSGVSEAEDRHAAAEALRRQMAAALDLPLEEDQQ